MGKRTSPEYYIGLDIGADAVGYAVTSPRYDLLKFKGEPMWGVSLFGEADTSEERRMFRSARRRLDRRQQRVHLLQELFAKEISAVDPQFFIRLRESGLRPEDKSDPQIPYSLFSDAQYTDRDYHRQYPTIHHLIRELMRDDSPHDVRLVYLACAWLVSHRGHFNDSISADDPGEALSFDVLHRRLMDYFIASGYDAPWQCGPEKISEILRNRNLGVTAKEKAFANLLNGGKRIKNEPSEAFPYGKAAMLRILCGGKASLTDLYQNEAYEELGSFSFARNEEENEKVLAQLEDDAELLRRLQDLYDWSILVNILSASGKTADSISEAKVKTYEQHKRDLAQLKDFICRYCPEKYQEVFRDLSPKLPNYPAYSYQFKTGDAPVKELPARKASQREFCDYLKGILKETECEERDRPAFAEMMARIEAGTFMPKQLTAENRVIPQQLYQMELKKILENASHYLPFLNEEDEDRLSVKDKILSIFLFRVPYFVGPLNSKSPFAWLERKAEGRILPWNFEKVVNLDKSEQAFIDRMTGSCTYLPGEPVLPRQSLLYNRYTLLNELNNLRIDGAKPPVEAKQGIVNELFLKQRKVSIKQIKNFLVEKGYMKLDGVLSGLDATIKSSLGSQLDFSGLMARGELDEEDVERIIAHSTCTESQERQRKWIDEEFPQLPENDRQYLGRLKYTDFGRLSKAFLDGIIGANKKTGQAGTILELMWETNDNLMELLSDRYTFQEQIRQMTEDYYHLNPRSLQDRAADAYLSGKATRPLSRAAAVVKDVVKAQGRQPRKIFINSARDAFGKDRGKQTVSRKEQILEKYRQFPDVEVAGLKKQLEELGEDADNRLRNETLYLYFLQLGRCMYTGEQIDLSRLTADYNKEHIYPRSLVMDGSVHNNLVLVRASVNKDKDASFPISPEIQHRMLPFWKMLMEKKMITGEKFRRLTRTTPFLPEEKINFINQQQAAVNQTVKVLAQYLGDIYPDAEIVYVKEDLVTDFRGQFDFVRVKSVNELYHAKDAYLNTVVGNVYHEKFNRRFFRPDQKYSINPRAVFTHRFERGGELFWEPDADLEKVKSTYQKRFVRFSQRSYLRKGAFFKMNPLKAGLENGMTPRKKGLDVDRYGGYPSQTTSFFVLAHVVFGKKGDLVFVPVANLVRGRFLADGEFAKDYIQQQLDQLYSKARLLDLPMGTRVIKANTMLEIDGFRMCIAGKTGSQITVMLMEPLFLSEAQERYIRRLERVWAKKGQNPKYKISQLFDRITTEENLQLYDELTEKLQRKPYSIMPKSPVSALLDGRPVFTLLSLDEQAAALSAILSIFKMGRVGPCDLALIGGKKGSGAPTLAMRLSNWAKQYSDVRIVDLSPSGLFEERSGNLLEML